MAISETMPTLPKFIRGAFRMYRRRAFAILFYSLLFTIAAGPVMNLIFGNNVMTELLLGTNVVLGVVPALAGNTRRIMVVLALGAWAFHLERLWLVVDEFRSADLGLWTVIAVIAAAGSVRYAMRSSRIDGEHLCAALSAYLLAGLFFGVLHFLLEQSLPGSYSVGGGIAGTFTIDNALYFS